MKGLKPYFEDFHKVKYTVDAIKSAVELSARYISDRKLPDKAIDVMDKRVQARCFCLKTSATKTIGVKEIEATIATIGPHPAQVPLSRTMKKYFRIWKPN